MTINWPGSLAQCPVIGWSEQKLPNVASFTPEIGPPIRRRRGSAAGRVLSATFHMTRDQAAIFDAFFEEALYDGALPFQMTHPRTGLTIMCLFEDVPQLQSVSGSHYVLEASLRILP